MLRVVFDEHNLMSVIGRACLDKTDGGHDAGIYVVSPANSVDESYMLRDASANGMVTINVNGNVVYKYICERIQEDGRIGLMRQKERSMSG